MSHNEEFDQFADGYSETLDSCVGWSGGGARSFATHKAQVLCGMASPDRILDYGCGVGLLAQELARVFPTTQIDGFDISTDSISRVPDGLKERGHFTDDFDDLGGDYDLVVVSNVLHHVPPIERVDFVKAGAELLQPNGIFAIFEHNPLNPMTRWVVSTCAFDEDAILLWPKESRSLLETADLNLERSDAVLFFPPSLSKLWRLESYLSWLPLGAQYLVIGSKR